MIGRREFVVGIGGAAAWPVVARAQQGERVRRIGVLYFVSRNETQGRDAVFKDELKRLGWNEGRNVTIIYVSPVAIPKASAPTPLSW
jgi:putative ABC transport system substrate-binding protein